MCLHVGLGLELSGPFNVYCIKASSPYQMSAFKSLLPKLRSTIHDWGEKVGWDLSANRLRLLVLVAGEPFNVQLLVYVNKVFTYILDYCVLGPHFLNSVAHELWLWMWNQSLRWTVNYPGPYHYPHISVWGYVVVNSIGHLLDNMVGKCAHTMWALQAVLGVKLSIHIVLS